MTDKDFEQMQFPAHRMSNDLDLLKTYSSLKIFPEFNIKPDDFSLTKVFRYIVFAYDKMSPLVTDPTISIAKQKSEALKLAGFVMIDEKYDDAVFDIITCRNLQVTRMIGRYCRMQGN